MPSFKALPVAVPTIAFYPITGTTYSFKYSSPTVFSQSMTIIARTPQDF
jgi:hypothetical protein